MNRGKTPYILIVEDDRDIAAFFRRVLDLAGYRTGIVFDGRVAIEHILRNPPDILLLDLLLPGVPGAEVLKAIHSREDLKQIRVVIVTGYSQIVDTLPFHGDLVLYKPVSPDQLSNLVGRLTQDDQTLEKPSFTQSPWDENTGLYHRDFFINRLECALENYKDNDQNLFGLITVNLAESRDVPPGSGYVGKTIQEIVKFLKTVTRPTDTISRFPGDHFQILIENLTSVDYLPKIVDRIQRALDKRLADGIHYTIEAMSCTYGGVNMDDVLVELRTASTSAD
jgi:PleD family two-component response regulator